MHAVKDYAQQGCETGGGSEPSVCPPQPAGVQGSSGACAPAAAEVGRCGPGSQRAQRPVWRRPLKGLRQAPRAQLLQQQPRVQVAVALPHWVGRLRAQVVQ